MHSQAKIFKYSTDRAYPVKEQADQNRYILKLSHPSTLTSSIDNVVMNPEFLRPLPKPEPRKPTTKGRKKGKSTILTETPEKMELNDTSLTLPKENQKQSIKKRNLVTVEESDDEDNISLRNLLMKIMILRRKKKKMRKISFV